MDYIFGGALSLQKANHSADVLSIKLETYCCEISGFDRESIEMPISMGRPICGQLHGRRDVLMKFFNKQL